MTKFYLLFISLLTSVFLYAQVPTTNVVVSKIGFEKTEHNFGTIKEESGKVSYEFKFTNKTDKTITISNVKASCGCTTPSWTRSAVEPGMSGYVKAQYDPLNRPNAFTKSLSVSYIIGTEENVEILLIKGFVTPRVKTVYDFYPIKNGSLRFASDYLNFYSITTKEPVIKEFKLFNDGVKRINFTSPTNLPDYLKIQISPLFLNPKDSGVIKVSYDAKLKNDLGYVYEAIELTTDDTETPVKKLFVVADISEYFPPMSKEDSIKAPKISFDRSIHNFGTINQGDVVTTNFIVTNTGKSDLKIYKTKSSCGCTVSEPEKMLLKAGEKTNLKVTFNSAGKMGQDSKSVTVYCNDPTYSQAIIMIKSDIQTTQQKDTTTIKPTNK